MPLQPCSVDPRRRCPRQAVVVPVGIEAVVQEAIVLVEIVPVVIAVVHEAMNAVPVVSVLVGIAPEAIDDHAVVAVVPEAVVVVLVAVVVPVLRHLDDNVVDFLGGVVMGRLSEAMLLPRRLTDRV